MECPSPSFFFFFPSKHPDSHTFFSFCDLLLLSIQQDTTVVGRDPKTDEPVYFYHPALQSAFMFSGEALCLALHALLSAKATRAAAAAGRPPPRKKATRATIAAFAAPALLDAAGTTLINVGLFYTAASTYQMLRGTLVVFAGVFTVTLLRRRLHLHHWLGIVLITAGAALLGASSVIYAPLQQMGGGGGAGEGGAGTGTGVAGGRRVGASSFALPFFSSSSSSLSSSSSSSNPLLGDLLIVAAQAATALQFITEEKMLERHRVPALLAVGLEGAWGLLLCSVALPALTLFSKGMRNPLQVIADPARAARVVRRAAAEALAQLEASPRLRLSTAATVLSIAAFNFFGVSVTKRLSGGSRAAADAARTLLVWGVSLALGWESFHALQVLGFVVLLAGSSLYNELIRGCLPPVPSSSSSAAADASSRQRLLRQQQRASSASGTRHHHHHHHHHHRRPSSAGNAADVEEGGMLLSEPLLPVPPQGGRRRRGALAEGEEEEEETGGVEVENLDEVVAAAAAADDASSASSDDEQGKGPSPSRPGSSSSQQQQKRAHFAVNHEQPPPATLSTPPRPTPPSSSAGPSSLLNSSSSATTAAAAATLGSLAPRPGGIPSSRPLPAAASQHRSHHHHRYTLARSMRLFPPAAMSPHSLASPLPSGARAGESYSYYYGSGGEDGNSEDREIDQALWGDYLDTPDPSGRGG